MSDLQRIEFDIDNTRPFYARMVESEIRAAGLPSEEQFRLFRRLSSRLARFGCAKR